MNEKQKGRFQAVAIIFFILGMGSMSQGHKLLGLGSIALGVGIMCYVGIAKK